MAIDKRKMEHLLSLFPPGSNDDKDDNYHEVSPAESASHQKRRIRSLKPQKVLDLHGVKGADVQRMVVEFLEEGQRSGVEKILIIHGKGNHSKGEPVLRRLAIRALESSALAGEFGQAPREMGGSGALWVVLRRPSR